MPEVPVAGDVVGVLLGSLAEAWRDRESRLAVVRPDRVDADDDRGFDRVPVRDRDGPRRPGSCERE